MKRRKNVKNVRFFSECDGSGCIGWDDYAEAKTLEQKVMDWAAANPEPRYPTWKEWHDTMFAESFVKEVPCPKFFLDQARGEIMCAENEDCPDCWRNPIPADIAEKLGVKPIGGVNNG